MLSSTLKHPKPKRKMQNTAQWRNDWHKRKYASCHHMSVTKERMFHSCCWGLFIFTKNKVDAKFRKCGNTTMIQYSDVFCINILNTLTEHCLTDNYTSWLINKSFVNAAHSLPYYIKCVVILWWTRVHPVLGNRLSTVSNTGRSKTHCSSHTLWFVRFVVEYLTSWNSIFTALRHMATKCRVFCLLCKVLLPLLALIVASIRCVCVCVWRRQLDSIKKPSHIFSNKEAHVFKSELLQVVSSFYSAVWQNI